jgi:hypothetical protein
MKKQLTLKKVTLRNLDDVQLTDMAGAQNQTPPVIIPTEARETCNGCPTVYSCAPKC